MDNRTTCGRKKWHRAKVKERIERTCMDLNCSSSQEEGTLYIHQTALKIKIPCVGWPFSWYPNSKVAPFSILQRVSIFSMAHPPPPRPWRVIDTGISVS
jgi:hypothetical protein